MGKDAHATNECGVISGADAIVVCDGVASNAGADGSFNVTASSDAGDVNPNTGIRYIEPDGLTLNVGSDGQPDLNINGNILIQRQTGPSDIVLNLADNVHVTAGSGGVVAFRGQGADVTPGQEYILNSSADITNTGSGTFKVGVQAQANYVDMTLNLTGGTIETFGDGEAAMGVWLFNGGRSDLTINTAVDINVGTVGTPASGNAYGIYLVDFGGGDSSTLTLNMTGGHIDMKSETSGAAIRIDSRSPNGRVDANISGGSIQTAGNGSAGVSIRGGNGNGPGDDIYIGTAPIRTFGDNSAGVFYSASNSGINEFTLDAADILTSGLNSIGVSSILGGSGENKVKYLNSKIETLGDNSRGVNTNFNGSGINSAEYINSTIKTIGDGSVGVNINNNINETGEFTASLGSGTEILTSGDNSDAASIRATNTVSFFNGNVYGVLGEKSAEMNVTSDSVITALGDNSDGISLYSIESHNEYDASFNLTQTITQGGTVINFDIDSGIITGGSGDAAAIRMLGGDGSTLNIAAGATINGAASGTSIDSSTDAELGIASFDADMTVTTAGVVTGDAFLGLGNDTFILEGGTFTGDIYGDGALASTADGNDTFIWNDGTLAGSFFGQSGSDTALVTASQYDGSQMLNGGDDASSADGFIDTLTLDGLTVTASGTNVANWEVVALNNSNVTLNGLVTETVNVCNGSSTLGGAGMVNDVLGCASDDTITITDTTIVSNVIEGAGGADVIAVLGDASVAGGIYGGAAGNDGSAASDGNDDITINTTGTVALVDAGDGDDTVALLGGMITNDVMTGAGKDTVTLAGAAVGGDISTGDGDDTVALQDGMITNDLMTGAGKDTVTLAGAAVGGDISTGDGDDTVALQGGMITNDLMTGAGKDTVTLAGAAVGGDISTGDGDDSFNWTSGALGSFTGGSGSDEILVTASEYDGSQVLNGGDDTSFTDGFVDTLTFQGLTMAAPAANLLNWENIAIGAGARISFSDGPLMVGALTVNAGGTLNATEGPLAIIGDVRNLGGIDMQDGTSDNMVTVSGNYSGGGVVLIDVDFAADTGDTLVIEGDVTGGPTVIVIADISTGEQTGNDLLVIDVAGSTDDGDFILAGGPATKGALDYELEPQGTQLFLTGTVNPTGITYGTVPAILSSFIQTPTLAQRMGARKGQALWMTFRGEVSEAALTSGSSYDSDFWGFQVGQDFDLSPEENGRWVLGLTGQYGWLNSEIASNLGSTGKLDTKSFGLGALATWYGNNGTYVDVQGQINWLDSNISSSSAGSLVSGHSSTAYVLSFEAGYRLALGQNTAIIPQSQLALGNVDGGTFTDSVGNDINLGRNNSTIARIGLAYELSNGSAERLYLISNLLHDFSGGKTVNVDGRDLTTNLTQATWGQLGFGGNKNFGKLQIYGEASYRTALGDNDNEGLNGTIGLRFAW